MSMAMLVMSKMRPREAKNNQSAETLSDLKALIKTDCSYIQTDFTAYSIVTSLQICVCVLIGVKSLKCY